MQFFFFFFTQQRCLLSGPPIDSLWTDASLCRQLGWETGPWTEVWGLKSERKNKKQYHFCRKTIHLPANISMQKKRINTLWHLLLVFVPEVFIHRCAMLNIVWPWSPWLLFQHKLWKHLIPAALSFYTIRGNSSCCHSVPSVCWQGVFEDTDQWAS